MRLDRRKKIQILFLIWSGIGFFLNPLPLFARKSHPSMAAVRSGGTCHVEPDQELMKSDSTFHSFLKSAEQLNAYLRLHFKEDTPDRYEPLVRAAADVFELPEQFLTCLFFKESTFKSNAKSFAGAKGIAQLMPIAAKEINQLVAIKNNVRPAYRDRWEKYFDEISKSRDRCPVPNGFGPKQVIDPVSAIAGGALLARFYYDKLISGKNNYSNTDLFVLLSGAYDMGYFGFDHICSDKLTLSQCKMKVPPETYSQMIAVENCIQPNNWSGMIIPMPSPGVGGRSYRSVPQNTRVPRR